MVLYMDQLRERYAGFGNLNGKIARETEKGMLTPVARGVYETDPDTDGRYLAGCICYPSYLSFEFALSEYDLIPEQVAVFTSATFRKGKSKRCRNAFGRFAFRDVPAAAYPKGVLFSEDGGHSCQIASPEKALCDKLYIMPPVRAVRDMEDMLFEDLRVEEEDFRALDFRDLLEYAPLYRSNNLYCLERLVRRMEK